MAKIRLLHLRETHIRAEAFIGGWFVREGVETKPSERASLQPPSYPDGETKKLTIEGAMD